MSDWMTIDDLSDYLQVPVTKIRHLMKLNRIPFHSRLGTPRFFKPDIDSWMRTPEGATQEFDDKEKPFLYRDAPIKNYMLTASQILQGKTAWDRLTHFIRGAINTFDETGRGYLYRKEFEPLMKNSNDYLRVSCQLGLIDNKREGIRTHYRPTEYARRVVNAADTGDVSQIIREAVLNLVKHKMETTPQERHSIFLLWYFLEIRKRGLEPEESHYRKEGEDNYYPTIRLNFTASFYDFLFEQDSSKEREFLEKWNKYIKPITK